MICALVAHKPTSGLRLYFHGPMHCGQDEAVHMLASRLNARILDADFSRINAASWSDLSALMQVLVREAWLHGALLRIHGLDMRTEPVPEGVLDGLWRAVDAMPVDCVIESAAAWVPGPHKPLGMLSLPFTYPGVAQRQTWWRHCLAQQHLELEGALVADLALRYRMTYAQISEAAAVGAIKAGIDGAIDTEGGGQAGARLAQVIFAAARAQSGHELAALATKIEPHATWEDLILPEDETAQLHEICARFNHRDKVFNEWGFAQKVSYGRGITALFSGGSGTGKSMAAEVIANALALDLYRIDLAQVVSKYIGETEKNLDRVFTAATNANAILFFDEADALFGKRTEVKDSHDRYANLEISYLLQKMEQYEGIAILATNLADNLDQAFTRRLAFSIHFPFPDEAGRCLIWKKVLPDNFPVAEDLDLEFLISQVKMSGGNIRNIAMAMAFLAASDAEIQVSQSHFLHALQREFQKLGKDGALESFLNGNGEVR
jgi:AAA+ superfamily predicted ATPase